MEVNILQNIQIGKQFSLDGGKYATEYVDRTTIMQYFNLGRFENC